MIKATAHTPPLTHADTKTKVLSAYAEGSPQEERSESKSTERKEKRAGLD